MTNPYLTLESVSHVLPDGRTLFADLNDTFDQRRTGLVGRNGVGKSLLARVLAGRVRPAAAVAALVLVSHDDVFLDNIGLTDRLLARMAPGTPVIRPGPTEQTTRHASRYN